MEEMTGLENHYFHPLMDSGKNWQRMVKPSGTVSWGTKYLLILELCLSLFFSLQKVTRDVYNGEIRQTLP